MMAFKNSRKARLTLGLLALCGTCLAITPAFAQNDRDVANRMDRLENEVQTLSRAIYKGEEPPPGAFSGGNDGDMASLGNRMDQLETQIRDMTGRLEEQDHKIDQLQQQFDRMSGDVDMRLNGAAGQPPQNTAAPYTAQSSSSYTPPQPSASMNGGATMTGAGAAAGSNGAGSTAGGNYQWSSSNPGEPSLGTLGSVSAPNDAGAQAYENAFAQLKNGQYDAAEQGFQTFLAQYPNHTLASNAKYWLGETYYARGQYDKASRTFAQAYQQYPKSAKAPDDLLKLGLSLAGMGKKDDACVALGQIEKEFAATAGPVLRRAKEEMQHFGC